MFLDVETIDYAKMSHRKILSVAFNMSLGYAPVILTILLSELIAQDVAIYIGMAAALTYAYFTLYINKARMHNYILYLSTFVLSVLALATLLPIDYCPKGNLPITLEMSIAAPLLILHIHRSRFVNYFRRKKGACDKRNLIQSAESTVVAGKVILILSGLQFLALTLGILFWHPLTERTMWIYFNLLPGLVFLFSILLNQVVINFFNSMMAGLEYVPIVNERGDVIGKSLKVEAISYKNTYINPVIRIAVVSNGRLFLCNRSQECILDKGKTDIPMECYLRYRETLKEGVARVVGHVFPNLSDIEPTFSIMYHFENKITNRLIYLFVVNMDDESILCNPRFKNGKLWTLQQMEQNLKENFFCECLEVEYEYLKDIIYTTEKYKGS